MVPNGSGDGIVWIMRNRVNYHRLRICGTFGRSMRVFDVGVDGGTRSVVYIV